MALRLGRVVALAVLVCRPIALPAQSDSVALASLLAEAEQVSPRILAARASARAAAARIPSATRPPDPQLQLGWMNYAVPDFAPMAPLSMRQVQVMQMVPIAGRLRAMHAAFTAGAAESSHDLKTAEALVRREVSRAFFQLRRADGASQLARDAAGLARDLRDISAAMLRAGEGQQADVLRADVEVARMHADVDAMEAMRAAAASDLVAMLTRAPGSSVGPTAEVRFPAQLPTLDAVVTAALDRRPELSRARATVERAGAMERVARSELWPDLTVGVQFADGRNVMGMRESMGSFMIGAGVPIFARRRQLQMREEAAAMRSMAEADGAMLVAETGAEVAMAHAALTRARALRERYAAEVLPAAEAARTSALAAYRSGSVPFMTVLETQMALVRYRGEVLQLDADEGMAWASLEALTGARWIADARPNAPGGRDD